MKISLRPKAGHRRVTEETRCNDCDDEEEMLGLRVEDHYHALYEERMNPFDQVLLLLPIGAARTLSHLHAPSCLFVCLFLPVFSARKAAEAERVARGGPHHPQYSHGAHIQPSGQKVSIYQLLQLTTSLN